MEVGLNWNDYNISNNVLVFVIYVELATPHNDSIQDWRGL